jgi:hypothetical protein
MSDYRLEIPANIWNHQDSEGLATLVKILTSLQITGYTITREESPKPKPEVRTVTEYVRVYQCPVCPYNSESQNSVNSHRKAHK